MLILIIWDAPIKDNNCGCLSREPQTLLSQMPVGLALPWVNVCRRGICMMQSCMLVGTFRVSGQDIIRTTVLMHGLMRWTSKPQSKSLGVIGIYDAFNRVHDNSGTSVHPSHLK